MKVPFGDSKKETAMEAVLRQDQKIFKKSETGCGCYGQH
jgi:hypothetical protein